MPDATALAPAQGDRLRVLLVEDEPPARRRMRALLAAHADVEIAGEAVHGGAAVEAIRRLAPDLVLLDVQLPVATGFEVIETIGPDRMPPVVFVTAYDEHAIRAFEVSALDYLLKPVEPARLAMALARARSARARGGVGLRDQLERALAGLRGDAPPPAAPASSGTAPSRRLTLRLDGKVRLLDAATIDWVEADGNYARLRGRGLNLMIRETMTSLEQRLAPHGFLRIQRGIIVRTDLVVELEPLFHGEYVLRLQDGTRLVSGRTYRAQVREAFALTD